MKFLEKMIAFIIRRIEESPATLWQFAGTFLFFLMTRNLLEIFSDFGAISSQLWHYILSYVALMLALTCLVYVATKEDVVKILKVVSMGFSLLILVPLVDLLVSGGKGFDIAYLFPEINGDLLPLFLTFFGSLDLPGASIGIRIELAIAIICFFFYILEKTGDRFRSFLFSFLIYVTFFVYGCLPYFLKIIFDFFDIKSVGDRFDETNYIFLVYFFIMVILVLLVYISKIVNKKYFLAMIRDGRWLRQISFFMWFACGLIIARQPLYSTVVISPINPESILKITLSLASISSALFFSLITNNIFDVDIDRISSPNRPSVNGEIPLSAYKTLSFWFLSISLILAATAGLPFFFFIVLFIASYFVYSSPPLRAKRWTFFSKFFIAANSLLMVLAGYVLFCPSPIGLSLFPKNIFVFFFLFFFPSANFIDIKDYAGDKLAGIKTLPVVMGLRRSKILIGSIIFISYVATFFIFKLPTYNIVILPIIGLIQFFIINRSDYKEKPFFIVYLLSVFWVVSQII